MKKMEIRLEATPDAMRRFIRGLRRTSGILTEDEAALVLEDSAADFTASGVTIGDVVRDITAVSEARVVEVAPGGDVTKLVLGSTLGASEEDVYEVVVPAILQDRIVELQRDGSNWVLFYYKDDGVRDDLGRWLSVAAPTTTDADGGKIDCTPPAVLTTGFAKLYELPANKSKHEVTLSLEGTDTLGFEYTISIWGFNSLPDAFADEDYLCRGVLLVSERTLAKDPDLCLVAQSILETKMRYLGIYVGSVGHTPDKDIMVVVRSFNDGDEVV